MSKGCVRFSEFWLFFIEHVFTLPLWCYEKSNQGTQKFAHKSAKRAHTAKHFFSFYHLKIWRPGQCWQHCYRRDGLASNQRHTCEPPSGPTSLQGEYLFPKVGKVTSQTVSSFFFLFSLNKVRGKRKFIFGTMRFGLLNISHIKLKHNESWHFKFWVLSFV